MAVDMSSVVLTGHLVTVSQRFKRELDKISAGGSTTAFQSVRVVDGNVNFYNSTDGTGTVIGSFPLPEGLNLENKIDKVFNAIAGNLAALDENGNILDSTHGFAQDSDVTDMLNEIFGYEEEESGSETGSESGSETGSESGSESGGE